MSSSMFCKSRCLFYKARGEMIGLINFIFEGNWTQIMVADCFFVLNVLDHGVKRIQMVGSQNSFEGVLKSIKWTHFAGDVWIRKGVAFWSRNSTQSNWCRNDKHWGGFSPFYSTARSVNPVDLDQREKHDKFSIFKLCWCHIIGTKKQLATITCVQSPSKIELKLKAIVSPLDL